MREGVLILGTRGSALARWQAEFVRGALEAAGHHVRIQEFSTKGDRILDTPLAEIGDKGLFTQELDAALREGTIHLAVHSLKDLQTVLPHGIVLAAVSERAAPWDAFVAHPSFDGGIEDLPEGAILATSSLRRQAQLLAWRPDLHIVPVRGNVDTRLRKLDVSDWYGIILAEAGLARLSLQHRIRQRVPVSIMLPAVGQGALGVVCAERDEATLNALQNAVHDPQTAACTSAERAFLRRLQGGCQAPVGAHAHVDDEGRLILEGVVASLDGRKLVRDGLTGAPDTAEEIGVRLAEALLDRGGHEILRTVRERSTS